MADPVVTVEKIVKIGLKIKEAMDKARHNEKDCREITRRVLRFSAILSQLQQTGMVADSPAMAGALEDLEETLQHALELVTACQERTSICRLVAAGNLSKQLRRVQDDILNKVMLAFFAINAHTTIVLLTIQAGGHPPPRQQQANAGLTDVSNNIHSTEDARRNSSWPPSYPNRGQIAGTRLGFGDLPISEQDGEHHVSPLQRDRFGLSRFISDDGELLMELRSAHAYPSLASAPHRRRDVFVMDSGAGFHVTPHRDMLQAYLERENPMFPDFFRQLELVCADGNALPVQGMGNIDTGAVRLEDVLHIPDMFANLVSVRFLIHQIDEQLGHGHDRQLRAAGVFFSGDHFSVFVIGRAGAVVLGGGTQVDDVYHLHALQP